MKHLGIVGVILLGMLLAFASVHLPRRGYPGAPAHRLLSEAGSPVASSYYIRNSVKDMKTPNIVTAVLADYRGFDTLGEVIVVLTAGLCCALILRKLRT